jgi:hypothetical protein
MTTKNPNSISLQDRDTIRVTAPAPHVSARYHFVPTGRIINEMRKLDFVPVSYLEKQTIKASRRGFQKHIVRLRRAKQKIRVRDSVAELVVINSHDGSAALTLSAGIFRLVCANGLMASVTTVPEVRIVHREYSEARLQAGVETIARTLPLLDQQAELWGGLIMEDNNISEFAERALELRWPDSSKRPNILPGALTAARRREDATNSLWHVYNRVQEKLIHGGFEVTFGRRKHPEIARAIMGLDRIIGINRSLWDLAAEYAKN